MTINKGILLGFVPSNDSQVILFSPEELIKLGCICHLVIFMYSRNAHPPTKIKRNSGSLYYLLLSLIQKSAMENLAKNIDLL